MKHLYLGLLTLVGILLGSVHVEAQYASVAQLSAGNDTTLGCNVSCFTLHASLTNVKATSSYVIDSSLSYSDNNGYNITGATSIASVDEIFSGTVTLPFDFCFYGNVYNQLTIGTNGAINFSNVNAYQQNSGLFTSAIPSSEYPAATIMAVLQDLDITAGGDIEYIVLGSAPSRKMVINYYQVAQQGCTGQTATFQVVLHETSNVIELFIEDKPVCTTQNAGASISGIQKDSTTALALPGKNNTSWGGTNVDKAYRFIPAGTSATSSVRLSDLTGTVLATTAGTNSGNVLSADFSNVCLTNNSETFVVSVTYFNCLNDSVVVSDTMTASKTVVALPVPNSPIYYCQGATSPSQVSATGTSLLWYSTLTGGTGSSTAPTPSTGTTGTFKYYVSQTISGCESARDSVVVTVGANGSGYTATSNSPVCLNDTIKLRATTVPGASFVWTGPSSYLNYTQNPNINSASYADSGTYTVTVSRAGCADFQTTTHVAITAGPWISAVGLEHPTQCQGTDGKIKLYGLLNNTTYTTHLVLNNVALPNGTFTTNGSGMLTITGLTAGFYNSVTVSYAGCGSNEAGPVILNAVLPPTVTSSSTDPAGCGPMADGTITISGLLPFGDYTMNWEWNGVPQTPILLTANSGGSVTITSLEGGVYTNITATRLGCTTDPEGPISLTIPPTPVVTPSTNAPICGGDTLFLYGSSTITTVTWDWSGPNSFADTNQNPVRPNSNSSMSGIYYLSATNTTNFCTSADSAIEVIVKPVPATPTATSNSPLCSGQTLNLSASGSGVGVTYNWNGPNSFTSTQQYPTISNVTSVNAGNYGVYASKDGCTSVGTATVSVSVTTTPNIDSVQSTDPTTCGGSNGTISLFGLVASTAYTVGFDKNGTPQTPQSLTSNTSGVVTITGLDAATYSNIVATLNACASNTVGPVTLSDPPTPATPTAGNNGPLCSGQTLSLTASSSTTGVSYSWTGPNSYSSSLQNPSISNIQTTNAGTYSVVATINGCNSAAATTSVTVNQTPATPVATSNSPICAGDTLNLTSTTVTGTYSWTGPNSFSSSQQNPSINNATTAATGNYIVNVSDNGCTSVSDTIAVVVNPLPAISGTTYTDPTTCSGSDGTITLTGLTAGATYTVNYSKNGTPQTPLNITADGSGNVVMTGLTAGVYSGMTVTLNACESNTASTVTLADPDPPVITASNNGPICEDETLQLNVTNVSGATFSWTGPNSYTSSTQNPAIANATPANSGTYTVIATLNNCSDTATTTATVNGTPTTPVITSNSPLCSGDTLTLTTGTVSGATYFWWGPNSFTASTQNTSILNASTAATGTYYLAVSVNACMSDTASASVVVNETPVIDSATFTNPTTCGGSDGTISLHGLIASTTFTVNYSKNGSAQSGSVTSNGSGVGTISGLTQGSYTNFSVTVNACTSNTLAGPVDLSDPSAPVISASNNTPICETDTVQLNATTVSGATYTWSGPGSFSSSTQNPSIPNATPTNNGTYTVIATVNNCSDTATTVVTVNATPTTPTASSNSPVCTGNTLSLTAGTVSGATYNWWGPNSFTSSTQNPSVSNVTMSDAGTYYVTATVNGCPSDTGSTLVVINETPHIDSATFTNPTTCGGSDGTISLHGLIASTTFTVNYSKNGSAQSGSVTSNGSGVGTISGLTQGSYTNFSVTVNACTSNTLAGPVDLSDPSAPVITASNNTPICETDTVQLSTTTVSGATYTWSGPGSFSSSMQNPSIPNATPTNNGTYTVIATVNNCSDTATTVVTVNGTPTTPTASSNSPVCTGDTLNLTAGTVSGAAYNWWGPNSFTSTQQNPSVNNVTTSDAGTYYVTATVNGCPSDTGSTLVVINPTPHIDSATFTDPTMCAGTDGTITLYGLSSNTTFTIDYEKNGSAQSGSVTTNGSGNGTITGLSAGTYTNFTATLNACSSNILAGPIVLTDPSAPAAPTAGSNSPLCPGDTLLLTASTTSGATYNWWGPNSFTSTQQNPVVLNAQSVNAGTYYVTMTVNNCTSDTGTTVVVVNPTPTAPTAGSNSPVCSGNDINLTANTTTGASYYWTGPNSFTSTQQNPTVANAQLVNAGDYILTISVNSCMSASDTVTVVVNETPVIADTAHTDPTMCGGNDGTITLIGLDTNAAYTVDYTYNGTAQTPANITSNGSGQVVIGGLSAGTYGAISVTINGCTSDTVGTIDLINPPPITVTASNNSPICEGDTIFLTASNITGATYTWTGPNGYTSTTQNPFITPTTAADSGYYTVTATTSGCMSIDSTFVTIIVTPQTPTASSNSPVCEGSDINLFASNVSGATYNWSGPNSFTSNQQNPTINNAAMVNAGMYIVSVTGNGCVSGADTISVVVNPTPVITDTAHTDPTTCMGTDGTITIDSLSAGSTFDVSYQFNGSNVGPVVIAANSSGEVIITGLGAGVYDSIFVSINGCISNYVGPIALTDPNAPQTPDASNNSPICEGDTLLLFGTSVPGVSYNWSGPGGFSSTQQNPVILNATTAEAGAYVLTVTMNGCTSNADTTIVVVDTIPQTPVAGSNSPICEGEDINLTATTVGGATYNWTGPNSFSSNTQNPVVANAQQVNAGIYIVTVSSNGCTSGADSVDVIVNETPIIADTAHTDPTMCMGSDGTITLIGLDTNVSYVVNYVQNGTPQTATIVSDGSGNVVITGLPAGIYDTITVMLNPCTSQMVGPIVLSDPGAPAAPTASNNTPICEGDTVFLFATGMTGVTYNWSGPNSFTSSSQNPVIPNATSAEAGSYTVTATLNNCTSAGTSTLVVINPTPTMPTAGSNSPLCEGDTLFLTATTVSGATYSWTGPNGFSDTAQNPVIPNATSVNAGIYTLMANIGACGSDTDSINVIINPVPATPTAGSNSPLCEGDTLFLTATTVGGASYDWAGPNSYNSNNQNPSIQPVTVNEAGTYYVSVSANGCTSGVDSVAVVVDTIPDAPVAGSNSPLCEGDTLYLTATTISGATYYWTGPNGFTSSLQNPVINGVTTADAGSYIVWVTTGSSCASGADTVDVTIYPGSYISGYTYTDPTTCMGTDGSITLSGFTPGSSYTVTYIYNGSPVTVTITADANGDLVISNLSAGVYVSVQAANTNGCASTSLANITLVDPNAPATPTAGSNSPVCEGSPLNLTASFVSGVSYNWTGPNGFISAAQNPVIDPSTANDAGTYYVSVTSNGCTSGVDSVVVVILPTADSPVVTSNSPVCEGDAITFTVTSTTGATFTWWGPNGFSSTLQNPVIASATTADAGTYYVVASLNSCSSDTASTVVVVNPTPAITNTSSTDPTTCNGTDGTITISGLAPGTLYTINYLFNGTPQGPVNITADAFGDAVMTGLSAGTYTGIGVAVGACGDTVSSTIVLTDPNAPATPVIGSNSPLCEGDTLMLTSTLVNGATYNWSGPGGFSSGLQNPEIQNVTTANAGTYSLYMSANGCVSATVSVNVVINSTPVAPTASSNSPLCEGSTLTLFAGTVAGATYTWTGPNGFSDTAQNPVLTGVTVLNAGTYYVNTNFGSCGSALVPVTVFVTPIPNPPTVVSPIIYCEGDAASALTAVGSNLLWYTQPVGGSGSSFAPVPNTSAPGTTMYYVSQSNNGCESDRDSIEVIVNPKPLEPTVLTPINYCQGEPAAALTAQGQNLLWYTQPVGGTAMTSAPTPNTNNNGTFNFYVSQTVNGCESDRAMITVNVLPGPQPPTVGAPSYCQFGQVQPALTSFVAGNNILWYTQPVGGVGSNTAPTVSTSNVGTFTYYVTQGNGFCESARIPIVVTIVGKPLPPIVSGVTYCQNETPIPLNAQGQSLLWYTQQTGGTGFTTAPLPQTSTPGSTTWWVSQTVNGCESDRASITVNVMPTPQAPVVTTPYSYCQDEPAVQLTPNGQGYLWYTTSVGGVGAQTAPTPNTSIPGVYNWWVSVNVEGCESERAMVTVNVFAKPQPPVTEPVAYCQGDVASPLSAQGQNLKWYAQHVGGTGTGATPTPITSSYGTITYYVSQTVNGCESDRAPLVVTVYQNVQADIKKSKDKVCRTDTASFMFSGTVVNGATYNWNFNGATVISGTGAGPYVVTWNTGGIKTVTVTVVNGTCTDTETDSIIIVEAPDAAFTMQDDACIGEEVHIQPAQDMFGQAEYHWNYGTAQVLSGSGAEIHTMKWNSPGLKVVTLVLKGQFCPSKPFSDTIKIHENPIAKIETRIMYNICSSDTVSLSAYYNTNYKYEWGPDIAFRGGGINEGPVVNARIDKPMYIYLTVYDDYGCSNMDSTYLHTQPCCNIWLPTAFTPNNDGRNDVYRLVGDGHIQLQTFSIRNRFGQVVFETANQYEAWDGRFHGQMCDVGTYFYYVRYKCGDKYVDKKGDVTLIR